MRFRNTPTLLLAFSLLASAFISAAFARDSEDPYKAGDDHNAAARDAAAINAAANVIHKFYPPTAAAPFPLKMHYANDPSAKIRAAAEAVRDAKDSKAKEEAQKKLAELLGKCYDEDMTRREKELTQVEERLKTLRDLLERRRTKKQEIIDLQTKVALNEAEGLGFYDGDRGPRAGGPMNISGMLGVPQVDPPRDFFFERGVAPSDPAVAQPPAPPVPAVAPAGAPGADIPR
jgi:hypothetical protein